MISSGEGDSLGDLERCPYCRRFFAQIEAQLAFLFDQYGFRLIHCEGAAQFPVCLVVLESADCRVRFVVDRGIPEIAIGTKSARITWENPGEGAVEGWQDLVALVDFLEAREIRAPLLDREGAVAQTLEEHLARISDLLQPHCDAIFEFMGSALSEQRRAECARFLESRNEEILRQIRERYPGQV